MLHELVHISINQGGVCDLYELGQRHPAEHQIEIFCNRVAGAILIPKKELLAEKLVMERPSGPTVWSDEDISLLAHRYWVSQDVLVRRLLICGLVTKEFYIEKRAQFRAKKIPSDKGFAPPAQMAISVSGNAFVRLVLDNYYRSFCKTPLRISVCNVDRAFLGQF